MIPKNIDELQALIKLLNDSSILYYQSGDFVLNLTIKSPAILPTPQVPGQDPSPEQYDVYDDPDLYGGRIPNSLKRRLPNGESSETTDE